MTRNFLDYLVLYKYCVAALTDPHAFDLQMVPVC